MVHVIISINMGEQAAPVARRGYRSRDHRVKFMRRVTARGRHARKCDLGARKDFGAFGALALDDPLRQREREFIDPVRIVDGEFGQRILEILRKPRHVKAAVMRVKIGEDVEYRDRGSLTPMALT